MHLGDRTARRLKFLINFFFWALWIGLFVFAGRLLVRLLLPFVAAYIAACALQPTVRFLENRFYFTHNFAATAVSFTSLTVVGGGVFTACFLGGKLLWKLLKRTETLSLLKTCGSGLHTAAQRILDLLSVHLPADFKGDVLQTLTTLEQTLLQSGATTLADFSGGVLTFLSNALPRFLLSALFFILSFLFFTRDFSQVRSFLLRQIPAPQRKTVLAATKALKETTVHTVRAYSLLGLATFAQTAVGFMLLKLPLPLLWALASTLIDALPVFGVGAVLLPLSIYKGIIGDTYGAIGALVLYAVCTVTRQVLQPRLVSKETGMPPLLTLLSMYVGWRVAGLIGLLAFPIAAMVLLRLQREGHLHIFK